MRIVDAIGAASLVACGVAKSSAPMIDAAARDAASCIERGLSCSDGGCPFGTGVYAIEGRPACASGGCCEPCPAPNVISGAQCVTAGQTQCDQRAGVCVDADAGCPQGYTSAGGACGDGVRVPFGQCCLPRGDGG